MPNAKKIKKRIAERDKKIRNHAKKPKVEAEKPTG